MDMLAVDVLMPVRDPAPWLEQAIGSLAQQTAVNARLILCVHGPAPGPVAAALNSDLPCDVIQLDSRLSFAEVLNHGLAHCTSTFVARLDSDDIALPARLATSVKELAGDPGLDAVTVWTDLIDESGRVKRRNSRIVSESHLYRMMRWKNVVTHSSVTFRRESVLALGGYAEGIRLAEDYDLWLRLLKSGRMSVVPSVLSLCRVHRLQSSRRSSVDGASSLRIRQSRRRLALARGESSFAANRRHDVWEMRQALRRLDWRRQS